MKLHEKTVSQEYLHKGKIINLRLDNAQLPDGKIVGREVVEHPGGVCVAAVTDDNEILLVRQFRYPYTQVIWEVPAGKLEAGEDPRECGMRELKEETGARADIFEPMGCMYPSPGYCDEIIYLYHARGLHYGAQQLDEDEYLECVRVPFARALEMVKNGEIRDAKTQIAILRLAVQ